MAGVLMRAIWNGVVLAESAETVRLEGNHYFPPESLNMAYFADSAATSVCPWKGRARYYDVVADGRRNHDAAWHYPDPSPAAAGIAGRVAFWHGVRVERVPGRADSTDSTAGRGWWGRVRSVVGLGK